MTEAVWDFFIAYARADVQEAEELYRLLADQANTYLDIKSLRLGDDWDLALRDAQLRSRITLVLVSSNSDLAFYQREEIASAIERARAHPSGHRVVPIYLNGFPTPMSEHPPYGLRIKHGLALSPTVSHSDIAIRLLELLRDLDVEAESGPQRPGTSSSSRWTPGYALDICFCVEADPRLSPDASRIWDELTDLPLAITRGMLRKNKPVTAIRVCVPASAQNSEIIWHNVPHDMERLMEAVARATAVGTLEAHPSILEQVRGALNGDWRTAQDRKRQVIMVWAASDPQLSKDSFDHMQDLWETRFDSPAKRFILLAPDSPSWNMFSNHLEMCVHHPTPAGRHLSDVDRQTIVDLVIDSV